MKNYGYENNVFYKEKVIQLLIVFLVSAPVRDLSALLDTIFYMWDEIIYDN